MLRGFAAVDLCGRCACGRGALRVLGSVGMRVLGSVGMRVCGSVGMRAV